MLSNYFMETLGRSSLVAADDTWTLMAILCVSVALAIVLEQRYVWASKVSGAIVSLIFALVLSNVGIIPTSCVLYDDIIWGFAVPMGIPLLLLQCNIKKIWRETGRTLIVFLIGAVGTCLGALLGYTLLHNYIPELEGIAAMMTGSYIGGGVNFAALALEFDVSGEMVGSATVADNLLMALYFFALIAFAGMNFFRKHFAHPHIDEVAKNGLGDSQTQAAAYWSRKDISLKDIAINFAYCVVIVWLAKLIGKGLSAIIPDSNVVLSIIRTFFGSQYVWITTLSMLVATYGEKQVKSLHGSQEVGTFLIYLFTFVIGVPASIVQIIMNTPLLLCFTFIMVVINMIFCFIGGKICKASLEECILASNANIGGPTTAAGMAISQGWSKLVGPIMIIGTFGYVIGTYLGILIGGFLGA